MSDFNKESLAIWNSLKPIIDKEIERKTAGMVQRRKMLVSTAPSMLTGVIGVTEPFGTEVMIPFVATLANAVVGDAVWVEFAYGLSNAVAIGKASLDEKDLYIPGDLTVAGDASFSGTVSGITAAEVGAVPEAGSNGFLYRLANSVSQKEVCKTLWTGTWSSGDLTVDGLSNYTVFMVRVQNTAGTTYHLPLIGLVTDVRFYAFGMTASSSAMQHVSLVAVRNGDTLTMSTCAYVSGTSVSTGQKVVEIIGIL